MKSTKAFQTLSETDLKGKLGEFKKELLKLNAQVFAGATISNPGKIKQTKKNIARILTILRGKEAKN